MKILSLTCPFCSAGLQVVSGMAYMYCQYCGQHFMVYDENPQAQVEKARKADGLLFDYAVAYLQKGDLKGLRFVFERIKKDSPSSSDGWFFEGCYHILLYMAQEDDWDSDIDDDLEFSDVMKEVRASWMRAFKYVEDGNPVEEYFRCVGYSLGHLSRLAIYEDMRGGAA